MFARTNDSDIIPGRGRHFSLARKAASSSYGIVPPFFEPPRFSLNFHPFKERSKNHYDHKLITYRIY